MAKGPIMSLFTDAVEKSIGKRDSDHMSPVYRGGDPSLTPEVIGVRIAGEPQSDFLNYVKDLG